MDYEAEQEQEIEALRAIFLDDFKIDDAAAAGAVSGTRCHIFLNDEDLKVNARLDFELTPRYPEEAPRIIVQALEGMSVPVRSRLQTFLDESARELVGTAMMFALHSAANDWLADHLRGDGVGEDEGQDAAFETRDEEVEAHIVQQEKNKFHGSPVTVESFTDWKSKFLAEVEDRRRKQQADDAEAAKKLTGRQLFEQRQAVFTDESDALWEMEADNELELEEDFGDEGEDHE